MHLRHVIGALAATTIAANAATVLTYDPSNTATGNYAGQTFTASDVGFTSSGDPLGSNFALQTIEIAKWSTTGYTTAQEAVYLNIYQGNTFIGSSTNTVNWKTNVDGILGDDAGDAYDFTSVLALQNLLSSVQYTIYFSTTNAAGDFITVRPGVSNASTLSGGNLVNTSGNVVDSAYDARFTMSLGAPVPEPAAALLGSIGLLYLLRRRR